MMKMLKKAASAVLALAVIVTALLSSGCSTPKVAATVDGTDYTTGEYLAFLYNSFYNVYVNGQLYYYDLYSDSYDIWNETYTYGDEETEYNLVDYIKHDAQETIVRQVALQRMMTEYGIAVSEEDQEKAQSFIDSMKADAYLAYGFNNDSYARMYREYNFNERTLFYTLYGENGAKAVPAADIRTYFDDNYLSYKIISFPLTDDKGEDLEKEEIDAITADLEGYLKMFNDGASFDEVIAQYKADTAEDKDEGKDDTDDADVADEDADTDEDADGEDEDKNEDEAKDEAKKNRVDIDSAQTGDKELVTALKEMAFGEAKILEYSTDKGVKTKALALRLDPEADRGTDEDGNEIDYFADQHDAVLYALKYEEFDDTVQEKKAALDVQFNKSVVKKCDPYAFRSSMAG